MELFFIFIFSAVLGVCSSILFYKIINDFKLNGLVGFIVLSLIPTLGYIVFLFVLIQLILADKQEFRQNTKLGKLFYDSYDR